MSKLVIGSSKTNVVPAIVRDVSPAHYIEKTVDANGKLINSNTFIDLTGVTDIGESVFRSAYGYNTSISGVIDMSNLSKISGQYACSSMFYNCTGITSADLSSLTTIGKYSCNQMFYQCTNLTTANLSSLAAITADSACSSMFCACTNLTAVDLSSLTTLSGETCCYYMFYRCTGLINIDLSALIIINGRNGCNNMFSGCTNLTNVDLSSLTEISGIGGACREMFNGCTSLSTIDLSSLITISSESGCYSMFQNCTGITTVDLSSLTRITTNSPCYYMFYGCTGITTVDLSSLTTLTGSGSCYYMFTSAKNITSLSFPSITLDSFGSYINQFTGMCQNITNITLHFPSNVQSKIETLQGYSTTAPFGAVAGTVLFDLPATYTLTGADSVTYTRNPKYDTPTALAWKVGAYGTTNFTPVYYTNGVTDPEISNSIYSDAACTTAVTTISTIA